LENIYESIKCLRPADFQEISPEEEVLFELYSNKMNKSECYKLLENNAEHIRYLAGVTQHIKRQVRGFDGEPGILENIKDEFIIKPGEIISNEIDKITAFIHQMKDKL